MSYRPIITNTIRIDIRNIKVAIALPSSYFFISFSFQVADARIELASMAYETTLEPLQSNPLRTVGDGSAREPYFAGIEAAH